MKTNWVYRAFKQLKKFYFRNDKRVAAYLVCVAIATVFWFLNALGKTYTVELPVPVKFVNFPNNKTLASTMPEKFELTVKAHGFTILRRKISFLFMPFEFNVNDMTNNRMVTSRKSSFEFPSKQFLPDLSYQLANDMEITGMSPDTLFFRFDQMGRKRVKVKAELHATLKKQYEISGDITTTPESVIVNGPQLVLDTLRFVTTENRDFSQIEETVNEEVALKQVSELFFEPGKVTLHIPVEEYTEAQLSVPVHVSGNPTDQNIKLFPAKVKATFLIGLSRFAEVHPEDFKLDVSYDDIREGKSRLKIKVDGTPPHLYELKISPEEVEYLIEN